MNTVTFAEAAERYIADQRSGWRNRKHAAQWASSLETYANPLIGSTNVSQIQAADVEAYSAQSG